MPKKLISKKQIKTKHLIVNYSTNWFNSKEIKKEIEKMETAYYKIPHFLKLPKKIIPIINIINPDLLA